ncbi:MAG TPA: hypothetical protein P5274_01810 [Candidatus Paceibacterota bacterium]|nr:hypothetical protein [Candidatus Paceibacterota bacterium]
MEIPALGLTSQVIQGMLEELPEVTTHDVRVLMSIDQFLGIQTGEKSLGPISDDLQKFYTFLVYKYGGIIEKERRGEISSQEDRELYLMSQIAWGIFWCEVKKEKPQAKLNGAGSRIFFREGFTAVIQEEIPPNVSLFTGDYNPEPAPDPKDNIRVDLESLPNVLTFPKTHTSGSG